MTGHNRSGDYMGRRERHMDPQHGRQDRRCLGGRKQLLPSRNQPDAALLGGGYLLLLERHLVTGSPTLAPVCTSAKSTAGTGYLRHHGGPVSSSGTARDIYLIAWMYEYHRLLIPRLRGHRRTPDSGSLATSSRILRRHQAPWSAPTTTRAGGYGRTAVSQAASSHRKISRTGGLRAVQLEEQPFRSFVIYY